MNLYELSLQFERYLPWAWTFFLIFTRFSLLILILPGIGMGAQGLRVRIPACMAFAGAACYAIGEPQPLPQDLLQLFVMLGAEAFLGLLVGMIPLLAVSGAQMAGQLASTTMGLNAGNLIDPTLGTSSSDLSRIYGSLLTILFLSLGGHYTVIALASTTSGVLAPGEILNQPFSAELIGQASSKIFEAGVMIAAPVLVALLLTNFVMGIISKAVPTINLFIISFPLTVGIGLILTVLALPEVMVYSHGLLAWVDDILTGIGAN